MKSSVASDIIRARFKKGSLRQEIHAMLKEVKNFSAEEYVARKLENYRREVLPNRIHGVRMPPFAIKDYLERKENRRQEKLNKIERRIKQWRFATEVSNFYNFYGEGFVTFTVTRTCYVFASENFEVTELGRLKRII